MNHSSSENWSRVVGFEFVNYTASKIGPFTLYGEASENDSNLSMVISQERPIWESMYCGRRWVIEVENQTWYVNKVTSGNAAYCDLAINMELLLGETIQS